jgi:VanZ family protein
VKFLALWAPVAAFMALLFLASSRQTLLGADRVSDKLLHAAAYLVLGSLVLRATHGGFAPLRLVPTVVAVSLTLAYGMTDELHQVYVPGRIASFQDWVADALGTGLAVPLMGILGSLRRPGESS